MKKEKIYKEPLAIRDDIGQLLAYINPDILDAIKNLPVPEVDPIIDEVVCKMSMGLASGQEEFIKQVTPKWYQWCIKRGGIFRFIATRLVKIIIITKQ